jgi:hypothetical protein
MRHGVKSRAAIIRLRVATRLDWPVPSGDFGSEPEPTLEDRLAVCFAAISDAVRQRVVGALTRRAF